MNTIQEEAVSVLHSLISTCRDGQEGFRTAAECVADDPELKMLLSSFSLQRSKFAGELEAELIEMGEHHPESEGPSISGAVRRGWISLKAAMTQADNHAVLAECERGEDAAVAQYKKSLAHELPDPIREIVQRQLQEVVATHNTIRALRDATPAGAARVMSAARESAMRAAEGIRQKSGEAAGSATETWGEWKSRVGDFRKTTEIYVRRNPFPSLVGALLAGFSIGMIFYALELRSERTRLHPPNRPMRRAGTALAAWAGFLAGRARSGYRASVSRVQGGVEELSELTSRPFRRRPRNRFTGFFQDAWRRVA